jgi:ferritin-like metal-binding protein YciE
MAQQKTLIDAFYEMLKDVHFAEKQALRACKKSAKGATLPELKQAFETHAQETEGHIERLQQVFELIGKAPRAKTCEAMQGIMSEMEEDVEEFGKSPAADAVIIACGQAVEHYEISRYSTLIAWARQLGYSEALTVLGQTLAEEKKADELLATIAARSAIPAAQAKAA